MYPFLRVPTITTSMTVVHPVEDPMIVGSVGRAILVDASSSTQPVGGDEDKRHQEGLEGDGI